MDDWTGLRDLRVVEQQPKEKRGPIPEEALRRLFAHVEDEFSREGCDHTLKITLEWIATNNVDRKSVVTWLQQRGGFCDCEVMLNSHDHWINGR